MHLRWFIGHLFIFIVYVHCATSNVFISRVSSSPSSLAKCSLTCEKTFPLVSNKIAKAECCSRGCRFYGIAEIVPYKEEVEINSNTDTCHNCCIDSYKDENDRAACNMGCDTMAKTLGEVFGLSAELSWVFLLESDSGPHFLQAGEVLEPDEILTDPGLARQFVMDVLGNDKIPEMQVKTLPVNSHKKLIPKEYTRCHVSTPQCLFFSFIIVVVLCVCFRLTCTIDNNLSASANALILKQQLTTYPKHLVDANVKV